MITGNPRAGRKLVALTVVLVVAILTTVILLAKRKKNDPENAPPLVPTGLVVTTSRSRMPVSADRVGRNSPQLSQSFRRVG